MNETEESVGWNYLMHAAHNTTTMCEEGTVLKVGSDQRWTDSVAMLGWPASAQYILYPYRLVVALVDLWFEIGIG